MWGQPPSAVRRPRRIGPQTPKPQAVDFSTGAVCLISARFLRKSLP